MTEFESNGACHKDIEIKMWTCVAKQSSYIIQQHHTATSVFLFSVIFFFFFLQFLCLCCKRDPNFKINIKFTNFAITYGLRRKSQSNFADFDQWFSPPARAGHCLKISLHNIYTRKKKSTKQTPIKHPRHLQRLHFKEVLKTRDFGSTRNSVYCRGANYGRDLKMRFCTKSVFAAQRVSSLTIGPG